ncbi:hypothetical protein [Paraliomyxa miuraensis]|uniref:hypothetical protein n=1 Tax=Paraliomyxa miuraensis TaxID=376150 RepID=UPI002259B346|nr:hypothetical protein [Paraliomyxa miuraensis]MCX4242801.1 hypothetical protein [Paraliomyxa miuraensis]
MRLGPLLLVFATSLATVGCFEVPTDVGDDSTSGTTEGTTAGTAADGSTGEVDVCPEYCGLIQDVCSAEQTQYTSEAVCLAVCADLPPGSPEDQLGNSVGCRRFQSVQASEAPDTFCGAGGPTGDGVCGAECEVFCGLAMSVCVGDDAQWPDVPSCLADCMQFPDDVEYNASVVSGDSFACRMYHLTVASLDPGVHCPHLPIDSPVCV